ncbi:flagellar capping protein [Oleiphilus sp. HI0071]|nr:MULTISPECIES: flagellar filament capping protein FliD [unclassified Oleiphilus]KZY60836.1 flagellar capping protein [Oleiphilus sp. HI0065]KZY87082.1 flagellar capping protein [Oleiphilus sp. HI0071]KZY91250.1 flagellar capping protein [Oleiphilus sp. HI0073]KZZ42273.1 flagellar capping protein [Oleiphilus sp. HI0118]KZZ60280.1 flagellar capping protein [Oleiphilus sp. HI0122]KZZ75172.1 flagellar capping protein [Oleiphilus sp. HI0130]KZZ82078.1 flagellar capping protein [Oleiphilus sp. H
MANVSSIGIGSGVLTSDLIDQLVGAEREPTEKRLDAKAEAVTAELSLFSKIQSAVTDLRLPARTLSNSATFNELSVTSSSSAFTASAGSSASAGSYTLEVSSLAKSQSLSSAAFADKDTTELGEGKLAFTIDGKTTTITIDATNNTLEGIASEINSASGLDASATIINNGNGFQLVISGNKTGASNSIDISVTDDGDGNNTDNLGLSSLSYTAGAQNLTQNQAASDAAFEFNGIPITRSTNTVDDLVEGLTINLTGTNENSPATLKVARNEDYVVEKVQEFIEKYNALRELIVENSQIDPGNPSAAGLLVGDSTTRTITSQIRNILGRPIAGLESDPIRSLAEVGITTSRETGNLIFNESEFRTQLQTNTESVIGIFADQGRASDSQVEFFSAGQNTVPGSYELNITQVATRASLTGGSALAASTVIDADNDELSISVDGFSSATISLAAGTYTQTELAAEIQSKINSDATLSGIGASVTVSVDGSGALSITSDRYGSNSKLEITTVDTNTTTALGLSVATAADGVDVAGTINGKAATGEGQILTGADGSDVEGLSVRINGGQTGNRGDISYIEGVGERLVDAITNFLSVDGTITAKNERLNAELESIAESRARLNERLLNLETRLAKQFTAADILIARLNSTQDFIKGQLEALAGIGSKE